MSTYLLFLMLGLGAGAVYALLGLGLVLKYRSTGVVDFAQGAVAMFGAYVFLKLRTTGELQLPWVALKHQVPLSSHGLPLWPALLITLVYGTLLGLLIFVLVYRPLLRAAPLTKVCASVGVMLALTAIAVLNFGTTAISAPPILPSRSIKIADVLVPTDRLYLTGIVIIVAVALSMTYRFTHFGLATRAGAENETGAALIGISGPSIAARNWMIATLLATLSGVLITPISSLDPTSYTLFVVPALGAVLIGRFQSFWITAAAGLGLGVVQSELIKLQTVWSWLPKQGLADGVPFLIILVTMTLSARRLGARGSTGTLRNPSLGRPTRPVATSLIMFVLGFVVLVSLHGFLRAAFMASLVTMCIAFSLVVLTGYVGQVSLAQMSFAGIGAFALTHYASEYGIPFPLLTDHGRTHSGTDRHLDRAARFAGPGREPRCRDTAAAAAAMDALGLQQRRLHRWHWRSLDRITASVRNRPRHLRGPQLPPRRVRRPAPCRGDLRGLLRCSIADVGNWANARRCPLERTRRRCGRHSRCAGQAVRLRALGLHRRASVVPCSRTNRARCRRASFNVQTSLALLAVAYVAGIGRIAGAVIAGLMFASDGLFVSFLDKELHIGQYQTIVAGVALAFTAIKNPDGVASEVAGEKGPAPRVVRLRDRLLPHTRTHAATDAAAELETTPTPASRV